MRRTAKYVVEYLLFEQSQSELLERIDEHLFAVEARATQKSRRPVRGKRRSSGRV